MSLDKLTVMVIPSEAVDIIRGLQVYKDAVDAHNEQLVRECNAGIQCGTAWGAGPRGGICKKCPRLKMIKVIPPAEGNA